MKAMTNQTNEEEVCCPPFDESLWHDKKFSWNNKKFITDKVNCFLHIPLNFGKAMTRLSNNIAEAKIVSEDGFCLSEHTSPWNMNLYFAVDRPIDKLANTTLTGNFYSRVYEGNFNKTGEWIKEFETRTKVLGLQISKLYMWYTTCPKCAKKYGKNFTVIIALLK